MEPRSPPLQPDSFNVWATQEPLPRWHKWQRICLPTQLSWTLGRNWVQKAFQLHRTPSPFDFHMFNKMAVCFLIFPGCSSLHPFSSEPSLFFISVVPVLFNFAFLLVVSLQAGPLFWKLARGPVVCVHRGYPAPASSRLLGNAFFESTAGVAMTLSSCGLQMDPSHFPGKSVYVIFLFSDLSDALMLPCAYIYSEPITYRSGLALWQFGPIHLYFGV